jgi:hypothetical protein
MNKACIVGLILFFVLFILFLAVSIYVFSLSLSIISKYKMVSYTNMTGFLIDSVISVAYLLLSVILLVVAGIALYGAVVTLFYCEEDYF